MNSDVYKRKKNAKQLFNMWLIFKTTKEKISALDQRRVTSPIE